MRLINSIIVLLVPISTLLHGDQQHAKSLYAQACTLREQKQHEQAYALFKQACEVYPSPEYCCNYAHMATLLGDWPTAIGLYQSIISHYPQWIDIAYNLAHVLKQNQSLDDAIKIYQYVIAHKPRHEQAHLGLACAYLDKGDFVNGWKEHAWHQQFRGLYAPELRTLLEQKALAGKTVLLCPEGGLGDTLLFIRFAQLLKQHGATIIAIVQKPLVQLCSLCPYLDNVIAHHEQLTPPPYHARATYMSLPSIMALNDQQMAPCVPYLVAQPELVTEWKKKLADDRSFKIGINWQVDAHNDLSRSPVGQRSLPLELFARIATIPGVTLYSLQQIGGLEQIPDFVKEHQLITFDNDFDKSHGAFIDSAALVSNLDLVISADSAIEHLAGGLGKPVWILLAYESDWRWFTYRQTDTPWYPTARLFRQPKPFDWQSVIETVATEIEQIIQKRNNNETT